MSQHVAFYEVFTNAYIELGHDLAQPYDFVHTFTFTPPANTATDNPAILNYMVVIDKAVDLRFRIKLNDHEFHALNQSGHSSGFIQEIVPSHLIKPGVVNKLECIIISGKGSISFSDMVIWYQRNV